jgi:hypothetical protein
MDSMSQDTFFAYKAYALLHDPLDKMCDLRGHEQRARELYDKIFKGTP